LTCAVQFAVTLVLLSQPLQGAQRLPLETLCSEEYPVIEGRAVPQREALEERSSIQRYGLFESLCSGDGRLGRSGQGLECRDVDSRITVRVELDSVTRDRQKGGTSVMVADDSPQVGESPTQISSGGAIR
jgi:hypothetical protein